MGWDAMSWQDHAGGLLRVSLPHRAAPASMPQYATAAPSHGAIGKWGVDAEYQRNSVRWLVIGL